jgi:1-phosphofructokinase family hexose kinase
MILTITPNTALDKILFINRWTEGIPMRTNHVVTSVGGKGLDASVVLSHLGVETIGLGFFAGDVGEKLIDRAEGYGIDIDPVWVEGETRLSFVISELKIGRHNHVIVGELKVGKEHVREIINKYRNHLDNAVSVICAGSLPPGVPNDFYKKLVRIGRELKVPVLVDSQSECMADALEAQPFIAKMNWKEFEGTIGKELPTFDKLVQEARIVQNEKRLESLIITLGEGGLLAVTQSGIFQANLPTQKAVNAAGAGDAVSSAIMWRLNQGDSWPEALSWAAATAGAVVLTEGTADCDLNTIIRFLGQVDVKRI